MIMSGLDFLLLQSCTCWCRDGQIISSCKFSDFCSVAV